MTELSLNEVESLAAKVGRGAGFSWGLTEEIGRGARQLAQGGFPWADALLALAEKAGAMHAPSAAQVEHWRAGRSGTETTMLCPIRVGALLIDDPAILRVAPVHLGKVGVPVWLAGLLAASNAADSYVVAWSTASLWVGGRRIHAKDPAGAWLTPVADVDISPSVALSRDQPPMQRALADDAVLTALGGFASRVNVPASESSRAKGAGGGSVDEE